ncbi:hypothetical protein WN48_07919 [Eufriesea mexicana]|uniref:Uncharacterized protein n=1 Tax=Eufriesea mexicana TaxID=516756 RepID=A0A310SLH3_9HYME|nr:hypothetical protein WN48_07919 [Eufriesea mexicana]
MRIAKHIFGGHGMQGLSGRRLVVMDQLSIYAYLSSTEIECYRSVEAVKAKDESELSSKRWASAPRRPDSPCVLGAPTSREAAGPPVQLEPVDLSVKTPVVLQVPRYSPAAIITAAARRIPSPSTTPTPPPLSISTGWGGSAAKKRKRERSAEKPDHPREEDESQAVEGDGTANLVVNREGYTLGGKSDGEEERRIGGRSRESSVVLVGPRILGKFWEILIVSEVEVSANRGTLVAKE